MGSKVFLAVIALALAVAFVAGLMDNNTGISILVSWLCVLAMFIVTIVYFASRKTFKNVIVWMIAIGVIAALSFAGGCGLTFIGASIGGGFMR